VVSFGAPLAHPDRRRTPAVAAFFDFIADEIVALRPIELNRVGGQTFSCWHMASAAQRQVSDHSGY
jgi:hypothetical protein